MGRREGGVVVEDAVFELGELGAQLDAGRAADL
jgi:hypothetical protein